MKGARWIALLFAVGLSLALVMVAFAFPYTVRHGDTLFSIARRYETPISTLVQVNGIVNPELIHAGQKLEIPANVQPPPAESASPSLEEASAATESAVVDASVESDAGRSDAAYVVQPGDTLFGLSRRFGVSVDAIAQANHINNANVINAGQTLAIPFGFYVPPTSPPAPTGPVAPAAAGTPPVRSDRACTRFNFLVGRDRHTGSRAAGLYVMRRTTSGDLAYWQANAGDVDSGWIDGVDTSFQSVYVTVTFYPADGSAPIPMSNVNPAGGTGYGWLTKGICHAIEIQYP